MMEIGMNIADEVLEIWTCADFILLKVFRESSLLSVNEQQFPYVLLPNRNKILLLLLLAKSHFCCCWSIWFVTLKTDINGQLIKCKNKYSN